MIMQRLRMQQHDFFVLYKDDLKNKENASISLLKKSLTMSTNLVDNNHMYCTRTFQNQGDNKSSQ